MKKFLLTLIVSTVAFLGINAQSIDDSFFEKVSYVGAFDGSNDWTANWTEWNPVDKAYPATTSTKGNGQFSMSTGLHITADETWSGIIKLDGWVYVDEGATLTVEAGTIVRATEKSGLFIQRGGKLMAVGTAFQPIVFTSNQAAGLRSNSDWAGIVLCGKAPNNLPGGEGIAEGGIEAPYGGTDAEDNSGTMKYVRIEFPGFEIATGSEVNGLTFCSVGSGTTIDYIQVSYSGDDGYEWFGGTVNAKHLISYKTEDDDFDTDNGYSGMVQFGLISRDPEIVDTDTANAFESDNDAAGSTNTPFTHAVFSNISAFGPFATKGLDLAQNHEDGAAMRLRRSTRLQIYNALFVGWGRGVRMESDNSMNAAKEGLLNVNNTIITGVENDKYKVDGTVFDAAGLEAWFLTTDKENQMLDTQADAKIVNPFNYNTFDFSPAPGSPVFNASYWTEENPNANIAASIDNSFFERVSYVGAFDGSNDWTANWTEWNPVDKAYPATTSTKGNGQFSMSTGLHITADETWSGIIKLDGWVYVDEGATLTVEAGTIVRATEKSGLFIQRGGKLMAVGTAFQPIVFTSNQAAGLRSNSDWAGIVLCGKAPNNLPGGEGIAEGGIEAPYGGTDAEDNSGTMKYVRIEFPGFEIATGSEVNGLTFCSVGSGTTIDYIQVSYSGDDGYEWFGGTVNAKHLISYKTEDDDFDTDNGYSGMVQFGLISRDPEIVDTDTANAFESDNDAAGSTNTPFTHAVFSNISAFGPFATKGLDLAQNHEDGAAMRLRRSTRLQIYNALFVGWGRGVRMESDNSMNAAKEGLLNVNNTIITGVENDKYKVDGTVFDAAGLEAWFLTTDKENQMLDNQANAKITDPFNYNTFDFQPAAGSPVFNASYWAITPVEDYVIASKQFELINYPNPFAGSTSIELSLTENAHVRIIVFNTSGVVVKDIQNGELFQGVHTFRFDASQLPQGMYFGKVIVGDHAETLKMIAQ